MRHHAPTWTLIDAIGIVAGIVVLGALAYPSYLQQVRTLHRADAKAALLDVAARQERYFATHHSYSSAPRDFAYAAFPAAIQPGNHVRYRLEVTLPSPTTFVATAVPQGSQTSDGCGAFNLTSQGIQSVSGSGNVSDCW